MKKNVLAYEMSEAIVGFVDRAVARLDGITNDEYFWEPAGECWSVRKSGDTWRVDLSEDDTQWTDEPPLTTIAWRLWHLGASPQPSWPPAAATPRAFADAWFTAGPASPAAFGDADAAVAAFTKHWHGVAAEVAGYHDADLLEPIGAVGGQYGDATIYGLIFHVVDELIHHSAEVGVLRDLYRAMAPTT